MNTALKDTHRTLPFHWYHDKDIFDREKVAIFDREWMPLGPVHQLQKSGDWFATELTAATLVTVKDEHGDINVFHNVCRHRGAPIVDQEFGHSRRFVCPYHGWAYQLNGQLAAAPGFECQRDDYGLMAVRSEIWNGLVWACLNPKSPALSRWLGDVRKVAARFSSIESLEFETSISNRVDVNWKTYADNSAEGYHLEYVHPALNASITGDTRIEACSDGEFVGFDVSYRGNDDSESKTASTAGFWIYKFPGILLHFTDTSFNLERVTPVSATEIFLTRWFWFAASVEKSARRQTIAASNQVMTEDIDICKRVQKNLMNGRLSHGLVSELREPGTAYIQQLVRDRLHEGT